MVNKLQLTGIEDGLLTTTSSSVNSIISKGFPTTGGSCLKKIPPLISPYCTPLPYMGNRA